MEKLFDGFFEVRPVFEPYQHQTVTLQASLRRYVHRSVNYGKNINLIHAILRYAARTFIQPGRILS